ncbi:hypothetical protein IFM89_015771 [Coptis chinensis]|uniref:Uncharacterized protein n=1 Tax=Coptis chinensis TaxID=261450 RepID=A0A835H8Q8_9MAGN|nr:hypothetical protein IFM89_015771 [Coptis chinensis]
MSSRVSNEPSIRSGANTTITTSMKRKSDDIAWEWVRKKKLDKARIQGILERQDEDVDEVEEQEICNGGGNRSQGISIGGAKKRKVVDNVKGPLDRLLPTDKMKQITLDKNNPHKQALKKIAWNKITKLAYEVGLAFNAVRPPSFTEMIHAIGNYEQARFYLNPSIYFKETKAVMETNNVIKACLFKVIVVHIPASELEKAMDQLKLYRDAEGTVGIAADF